MCKKWFSISNYRDDQQRKFSALLAGLILLSGVVHIVSGMFPPEVRSRFLRWKRSLATPGGGTALTGPAFTQAQPGSGRFVSLRCSWQVLAVIVAIIGLTAGAIGLTAIRPASASLQVAAQPAIHVQGQKMVTATGQHAILRGSNRSADDSTIRQAVVDAAKSYLGRPYKLEYGWTCSSQAMDCECLNRHAIWGGTSKATGTGLQLWYTLQGQLSEGHQVTTPQPGDLVFWDTAPNDGNPYGGNADHTGIYIGNNMVIDANAYYGDVRYDSVTLNGAYPAHIFIDVLSANGY